MVRRALAMATGEQYFRLVINFVSILIISRLLTPTEVGVSVIGLGIMTIALGLREFATSDFLIQRTEVMREDIRASFTVLFLLTALIGTAMFVLAPWFGTFYGEEKLARFLQVAAVAGLIEAVSLPITGLLRRDLAFGTLALVNTASAAVAAGTTIVLAFAGFSYMSVAWGTVAGAGATTILLFYFRPDLSILRPAFKSWGNVLRFGGYQGASFVINRTYEALPQLVLGHVLPPSAVGLYNRATLVSDIPDKIVLASVSCIAFPALAAETRQGRSLKDPYLRALGHITVFFWPALVLLVMLAYPVVSLILGDQWAGVVPLLQVMAIAGLAWFPVMLTTPVLMAVGANRDRVLAVLATRAVSGLVLCFSAYFGVMAMAASRLVTMPYQMLVSLWFVRRHVAFRWREVGMALWKSALVTVCSAAGPVGVVVLSDTGFDLSIAATVAVVVLAVAGWSAGVLMAQHPVLPELMRAAKAILETAFIRRLRDRTIVHGLKARGGRTA